MTKLRHTSSILTVFLLVGLAPSLASSQSRTPGTNAKLDEKSNSETIHWTSVLNRIAVEAKTLNDENARPEAVVAVADAFWTLDNKKGRELFYTALDLALAIESQKVRDSSVRKILVAAARRDISLAKDLMRMLQTKQESGGKQSLSAALDLVSIDPKAAEAIAVANARNGPSGEVASLVFELHKQDPAAAVRVYTAYLANVRRDDPSQLLWLAGYPFGYHEALGGTINPTELYGIFGASPEGLTPNVPLAQAFLTNATSTVDRILGDATAMDPSLAASYRALAFFMLTYLSPQVERYRPTQASQWLTLQQNVGTMIDGGLRDEITKKVTTIAAARERAARGSNEKDLGLDEDSLSSIEKLASSCQRDLAYSRATFSSSYKEDFKKALSLTDKISDLKLRANVLEFLYFDMTLFSITPKSLGGLDEGLSYAQRVSSPAQRGFLYLKLAEFAAKADPDRARLIFNDVLKTCDQIEDRPFRAALLFSSAYDLATLDSTFLESFTLLEKAIRLLNEDKEIRIDRIRFLRRVDLNCDNAAPSWYGDSSDIGQFNLIDILLKISDKDARMAEELATELPEGLNRVRSLAAIADFRISRAMTVKPKK